MAVAAACLPPGSGGAALSAMAVKQREREGRERGERVNRGLTQLDSNFCIETRKSLNMKVVKISKSYNFPFRPKFIRAMI